MPFCTQCGTQLQPDARFCTHCGNRIAPATPAPVQRTTQPEIRYYVGQPVTLPFGHLQVQVSADMDTFCYYRREFHKLARIQTEALRREYFSRVHDLDSFLLDFPVMYQHFRQPVIDAACNVLMQAGLYDISAQQFSEDHARDFCLCGEDLQTMVESFNLTIEANQERKARNYSLLPTVYFGGLSGIALAFATNVAVNAIAEADIRNADVNPKQRAELFARINPNMLLERAFLDYWRVFLTLTWTMRQRGLAVWYPTDEGNQRANGIYQNLNSGRIPMDKVPELTVALLQTMPFHDDYLAFVQRQFGMTQQTAALLQYFGA